LARAEVGPAGSDGRLARRQVGIGQIRSIMDQRCVVCHNEAVAQKNVRLDSVDAIAGRRSRSISRWC
jgi:hypothetical protein